jgi:hypothetical protein
MFGKLAIAAALAGLTMLGSAGPGCAAPPVPTNAARTLTVLEGMARPGDAVYALGSLGSLPPGALAHTFVLRNDTHIALTLDHLQTSCSCTTATVADGAADNGASDTGTTDTGTVIAPGKTLAVKVALNPQRLLPGLLHKSVWVFVQGQDAPAATLEMTGALCLASPFRRSL